MSIANLFNVPSDPASWNIFSFSNQDSHRQIIRALRTNGTIIPDYILDPIPPENPAGWLQTHQAAHAAFTGVLGISGNDLSDLDVTKRDQVESWVRIHAVEHMQAAQILGIF